MTITLPKLKFAAIFSLLVLFNSTLLFAQRNKNVLVMGANGGNTSWTNDVKTKLDGTGLFGTVNYVDVSQSTPTLAQLNAYGSVLVYSDASYQNATTLGNNLAAYADAGGGVVTATFTFGSPITGSFASTYYVIQPNSSQTQGTTQTLGTIFLPTHPTIQGITSFSGGSSSYRNTSTTLTTGSYRVANWSDGLPLVVVKDNVGPSSVKRVDLNFYPVSSTMRADFWSTATQGALLLAKALQYVSGNYIAALAPTIASFSPTTAATGTSVTITGTNFTGATAVSFGGVAATSFTVVNSTTITAVVAAGANGNVVVSTVSGTVSLAGFNYCTTVTPSVAIAASATTVCNTASVTFMATPTSGGTAPTYQWTKGGVNIPTATAASYTYIPNNGDVIACVMTANNTCQTSPTAQSSNISITVNAPTASTSNLSVCSSALPYSWNGLSFATAGTQTAHINNYLGCDSAATLNLSVLATSSSTTNITVRFGGTYTFNGTTYTTSGTYAAHLTNAVGCDSTATLVFFIDPKPDAGTDQSVVCGSNVTTVTLSGSLPTSGAWTAMASNLGSASLSATASGVSTVTLPVAPFTGTLNYIYTTADGKDTMSIFVNGPSLPVIEVHTGTPVLCTGATVQLCPLIWGYSNYQWYKDGFALTGAEGVSSCINIDASGIGSYTLTGTNGSGCWSKPSTPVAVSSISSLTKPTITVTGQAALCHGGSVVLTSSSASGNLWFKNGNSTGVTTQTYTATEPAVYTVLVSGGSCVSDVSLPTTIGGGIVAGYTAANATNNCDSTIRFTSTSVGTSAWYFGDGNTGSGNTVAHKYATVGVFVAKQIVTSLGGCIDSITQNITVYSCGNNNATCNIVPGFNSISNTSNGDSYTFISTSTISSGNMTYQWDLGNATTSTLINPTTTYLPGTYTVKLIVTGSLGCKDSITHIITVNAPCALPIADFNVSNASQCLAFNAFSFSNTSTGTSPSYSWNFGDGSANVITTAAGHTYIAWGTYTINLTATNSCGSNSITKTVTVNTVPPTPASISGATSLAAGTTTTLSSATSGGVWSSSNAGIATVDATTGVVTGVSVGTVNIVYTVTNTCGTANSSLAVSITTACIVPVASFTVNNATQCLGGNVFNFTNTSVGTALTYTWYFGASTASAITTDASHTYTAAATYTVTLNASNTCGSNSSTAIVTVNDVAATPASIGGANTLVAGTTTTLSSGTLGGVWSSSNTAIATIDAAGIVSGLIVGATTITYTVTSGCGSSSATKAITVTAACALPVASFTINNATQCLAGNMFNFTNTSVGTAPTYTWYFGDASSSIPTINSTHTYTAAATYTVTLNASNACGNSSSTATVTVNNIPATPASIGGANTLIAGTTTTLSSGTLGGAWSSSNTAIATIDAAGIVSGLTVGTTTITYTVTNGCGSSITTKAITVTAACALPTASFTINNTTQCLSGNSFSFTNTSTGTAPTYAWYFGDVAPSSSATNSTHAYTAAATYTVLLNASNACGNSSSTATVTVNNIPAIPASIGGANTLVAGTTTTLSSGTLGGAWSTSNGLVATIDANGIVTGVSVGSATITYTVTNGCGSSITTKAITVTAACALPVASFTINNTTQCLSGNSFSFTNTSTGTAPTYAWYFGDGSPSSSATNSTHTYTAAATYTVTLNASNTCGSNSSTAIVTVNDVAATPASIGGANTLVAGTTTTLSSGTLGGVWSSSNTAIATIDAAGIVSGLTVGTTTITYTVTSGCGSSSATKAITVTAACALPVASFTINNATQCLAGNMFNFTNTSVGTAPTYTWYFGDASSSIPTINSTHTYTAAATYTVTLNASNACGNSSSTATVTVAAKPNVDFTVISNTGSGNSYTFISSSTIASGNMDYLWDFGDATTSALVNPTKTYTTVGTYNVKLLVTSNLGCTASLTKAVQVSTIGSAAAQVIAVFPNPAINTVQVSFTSASNTQTVIKIVDDQGRVMQVQSLMPVASGINILATINISGLQSGIYTIYISDVLNGFVASKQIVKQ